MEEPKAESLSKKDQLRQPKARELGLVFLQRDSEAAPGAQPLDNDDDDDIFCEK